MLLFTQIFLPLTIMGMAICKRLFQFLLSSRVLDRSGAEDM